MKKYFISLISFLILFAGVLGGCADGAPEPAQELDGLIEVPASSEPSDAVSSEVYSSGVCAIQDGRIYFRNGFDGGKIYSMNTDGGDVRKLNDDFSSTFIVLEERIYYINGNDRSSLYSINTDGGDRIKLSEDHIASVFWCAADGRIYYSNWDDDNNLYSINLDGSGRKKTGDIDALYMSVLEGRLYFYDNLQGSTGIYSMKTDGSGIAKLSDDSPYLIAAADGWVYFNNEKDNYKLYAMRTDGSDRHKLTDDYVLYINVVDGRIYYENGRDEWKIYSMNTDGSDRRLLSDDHAEWLVVRDGRIYYTITGTKIYSINTDGGDKQLLAVLDGDLYRDVTYEISARLREDMPVYRFAAKGKVIEKYEEEYEGQYDWTYGQVMGLEIFDENNSLILSADFSYAYYDTVKGSPVYNNMMDTMGLHVVDVNFDGYKDVIILNCFAGAHGNTWYDCWLWDAETSSFVKSESFSGICNPALDFERKCIYSAGGAGADCWGGTIFKFIDGEFVITNNLAGDGGSVVEKELVNGRLKTVRESYFDGMYYSEDYNEQFWLWRSAEEEYYINHELWQLGHPRWYWYGGHHADEWLEMGGLG